MKPLEPEFQEYQNKVQRFTDLYLNQVLAPKSESLLSLVGDVMNKMIIRGQLASDVASRSSEIHDTLRLMTLEESHRRWKMFKAYTDEEFVHVAKEIGESG